MCVCVCVCVCVYLCACVCMCVCACVLGVYYIEVFFWVCFCLFFVFVFFTDTIASSKQFFGCLNFLPCLTQSSTCLTQFFTCLQFSICLTVFHLVNTVFHCSGFCSMATGAGSQRLSSPTWMEPRVKWSLRKDWAIQTDSHSVRGSSLWLTPTMTTARLGHIWGCTTWQRNNGRIWSWAPIFLWVLPGPW